MNYYPAFLNLEGKRVVVVGGGSVAERKIITLLKSGADVTVISPLLTKRLLKEKKEKSVRHIPRNYRKNDLAGVFLVIAATDSPGTNRKIAKDAPALVNVVDVPTECNFIAPSVIRRGPFILAISSSGTSPALSKTIRKELEKFYGHEFSGYLKFLQKIRAKALTEIREKKKRVRFLKSLAEEELLLTLRTDGLETVKKTVLERLKKQKSE